MEHTHIHGYQSCKDRYGTNPKFSVWDLDNKGVEECQWFFYENHKNSW